MKNSTRMATYDGEIPTTWFYFSFADSSLPNGQQFLGGLYIKGFTIDEAITRSHLLGVNPGGEIQFIGPIPDNDEFSDNVPVSQRERLLSKEELDV